MKRIVAAMVLCGAVAAAGYAQEGTSPVLRHTHYFVLLPGADAPTIRMDTRPFYTYGEGVTVDVSDGAGNVLFEGMAPLGQSLERTVPTNGSGALLVVAEPGYNGIVFSADAPWCVYAGGVWGIGSNRAVPPMSLWVPPDCERFTVRAHAPSPGESARVMVSDPSGTEVAALDGELDEPEEVAVEVPEAQRGAVWTLSWGGPQTAAGSLDDLNTFVSGELTPVLWPTAEWAEEFGQMLWERHQAAIADEQ